MALINDLLGFLLLWTLIVIATTWFGLCVLGVITWLIYKGWIWLWKV